MKGGKQVHGVGLVPVSFAMVTGHSGNFNRNLFIAPPVTEGRFKVEAASISFGAAVNDDGSNYWSIMLQSGSESTFTDLGASALSSASDFDANKAYALEVDGPEAASPKKVYLEAGDIVRILFTETNTATDLTSNNMTITLFLRHSPPGR
tara:strand:+ start:2036 stop:2485 length:450 start_codon:yes stop_codon:yes gene_type:complete